MTYSKIYPDPEDDMKVITCNLPRQHLRYIAKLLQWGILPSRSEYIRKAVAKQIEDDQKTCRYVKEVVQATDDDTIRIPGYNGGKPIRVLRRLT